MVMKKNKLEKDNDVTLDNDNAETQISKSDEAADTNQKINNENESLTTFQKISKFLFWELTVKTLLIVIISTFTVSILMTIMPLEKEIVTTTHAYNEIKNDKSADSSLVFYFKWIGGVMTGNLGRSNAGQNIFDEVKQKFPVTFIITFSSVFIALLISFMIGLLRHKMIVSTTENVIYLFTALPVFFLGYLLIGLFGFYISSMPKYILAIITLSFSSGIINEMSRVIFNSMKTELAKDYIMTARLKGLKENIFPLKGTIGSHAFRNAIISIVPRISSLFVFIICGCMVVEQVFNLQGLSFMLLDGLTEKDRARIFMVILLSVILVRIGTLLSNFIYIMLNPRYGHKIQ